MLVEIFCKNCEKTFEMLLQRKDRKKKQPCPQCQEKCEPLEFSRSNFDLRGSGWYKAGIS